MGLDINTTKFVLYTKSLGVSFTRTAMIGRQSLLLSTRELRKSLAGFGYELNRGEIAGLFETSQGYAESFFRLLGAENVESFDASAYEQATHIVDLNTPIANGFKNRFSAVVDGGTLEHVFDFPTALKNCMEMIEENGHFVGLAPANNFLGHGFYQFSPELFFRVFGDPNGFRIVTMLVFEVVPGARWYEIVDPDIVRQRVELVNSRSTYLAVVAQKLRTVPLFNSPIFQSDYVRTWASPAGTYVERLLLHSPTLMRLLPTRMRMIYRAFRRSGHWSRYNPNFFRRIKVPRS